MRHSRLQPQTMHSRFQASMRYIWRYKYLYLEQIEARACNGCAVGKRNLSGDTLLGMLVDEHQVA